MPSTDGLQPPLKPAEREIVKSYGGWTNFTASYGLKPWEMDQNDEAHTIVKTLAKMDRENEKGSKGKK
ncbi:hypothetical protein I302_106766 [Kwoniella bestiolae CBS 10118]|uniref:Uncharacterized protein n=1 Tax=Kwoniella bestiolae CBS 10118 TaxID=1296100 RepID=A0A1B9G0G2_9TREE|nr:hypothetical protein I302_05968 [Kwoniella bestiolae CBS 10118]OCF24508.1 hypothetical protein I302_05968 [Kwoniella bestiolae CBS 10118]